MNKVNPEAEGQGLKDFHLNFSSLESRNSAPSHVAISSIDQVFGSTPVSHLYLFHHQ